MAQHVGKQLTTAMPTSKTARVTVKASGLMVVVLVEITLVVTSVPTAMMDNVETAAPTAVGAGHLAPVPRTLVQTACVKEEAAQGETRVPLVIGTVTSPSANQEGSHTLTTTDLSE